MTHIIEIALQSFWHFVGTCILLWMLFLAPLQYIITFVMKSIHKAIRAETIRKVGYPPKHCDGDGDFADTESDDIDVGITP
jgi:hypothetical protein